MDTQSIIALLAAWAAILSTVLLIFHIRELSYNLKRQLEVFAYTDSACQTFYIDVTNMGPHPIEITSVSISYGIKPHTQLISNWTENLPAKLKEGDLFSLTIPRTDLVSVASATGFRQKYTQRLWISLYGSSRNQEKPMITFKVELAPFISIGQQICFFSIQYPR